MKTYNCDCINGPMAESNYGGWVSKADYEKLRTQLRTAVDRLEDVLKNDDGQAWQEARKALPKLKEVANGPA